MGLHWGGEKAALGFGLDWIRTLVSMATNTSYRVIMGKNLVNTLTSVLLIGSSSFLQVTRTIVKKPRMVSKAARPNQGLWSVWKKNPHRLIKGEMLRTL